MNLNASAIIANHYKECFLKHGDSHLGADWPKLNDLFVRYNVMLSVIKDTNKKTSILDFGCGSGMLLEYIQNNTKNEITYSGMDINKDLINCAKNKFKNNNFYCLNLLENEFHLKFDYVICNGVFTEKLTLSKDEMFNFTCALLLKLFNLSNIGIAFNIMSSHVDYEKDFLFHLEHDRLLKFVVNKLTRNYIIRSDYGLYEYTVYLYKEKTI